MADYSFELGVFKLLDDRLSGKTFICGEEMTKYDVNAYALISTKPSSESYPNASKWYDAVTKKVVSSFLEDAGWEVIGGEAASVKAAAEAKEFIAEDDVEETEEEKKAAEERKHSQKRKRVEETEEKEKAAEGREAAKASKSKRWKMFHGVFVRNGSEGAIAEKLSKISEELPSVLVARSVLAEEVVGFKRLKIALLVVGDELEDNDIFYDKVQKFLGLQYEANPTFYRLPCFVFDGSSMDIVV